MFRAIPCNLLLWGYDSWGLRQKLLGAIEVFLRRSVRRILRIQVRQVISHGGLERHLLFSLQVLGLLDLLLTT